MWSLWNLTIASELASLCSVRIFVLSPVYYCLVWEPRVSLSIGPNLSQNQKSKTNTEASVLAWSNEGN